MRLLQIDIPPFPYFLVGGSARYRPGDKHRKRNKVGVFVLLFVVHGELFITQGDREYSLRSNDILILDPAETHYGHRPTGTDTLFYWTHFYSSGEHHYATKVTTAKDSSVSTTRVPQSHLYIPNHSHLSDDTAKKMLSYMKRLEYVTINKYANAKLMSNFDFSLTLPQQEIFLAVLQLLQISRAGKNKSDRIAILVMEYLINNYHLPLTLELLSSHFGYQPAHLIRCMKNEFGETPINALNRIRIENAIKMLTDNKMTITETAGETGFSSVSYFGKVFRKHTGASPKKFAEAHIKYD